MNHYQLHDTDGSSNTFYSTLFQFMCLFEHPVLLLWSRRFWLTLVSLNIFVKRLDNLFADRRFIMYTSSPVIPFGRAVCVLALWLGMP